MKKITLSVAALTIAITSYGQYQEVNQCNGLTKDSVECKNITTSTTKLCHFHNPNFVKKVEGKTVICNGTTKKGNSCKRKTKDLSGLCYNHRDE